MEKMSAREMRSRIQQLEREIYSIQKIGQALSSTLHLDDLLNLIMKEITHLMEADRSTLYLVDKKNNQIWSKIALKAEVKEIRQKIGMGISGHVAATGDTINIPDAYQDNRFDPSTDQRTGYHTHSILCIPVWESIGDPGHRQIMGVIQVLNKKQGPFSGEDEAILHAIASEVSIALANARLYEELEQKYQEIDLLYEFEQKLSSMYHLPELLQSLIGGTITYLKCDETSLLYPLNNQFHLLTVDKNGRNVQQVFNLEQAQSIREVLEGAKQSGDPEKILSQVGEMIHRGLAYLKLIPLTASGDQPGSAILFLQELPQNLTYRELDTSQIMNIIGQKISRAIELFTLRESIFRQERLSAVGQMMSTIVHDLRSPINSVNGFLDLLCEEDTTPQEREEYSQIMRMEIQSITNMTTEILDFAKGKTSILPRKSSAQDIFKRFQPQAEQLFRNSGITLALENKSRKLVYVDVEKLTRVFYNIAKNAKEAMLNKGKFTFIARDLDSEVLFELGDNGPGIPDEVKGRLFQSFVTSGKASGTGLGLAIVKKIVDEHHGKIELQSHQDQGTVFFIKIPEYKLQE